MSIIDKIKSEGGTVIRLEPSKEHMIAVIQKRLEFSEMQSGAEPGSLIQITDSAYQAIAELTQSSIGLALSVVKRLMPSTEQLEKTHPYIITEEQVKSLGLTYEGLCKYWDSPLRGAMVLHLK